MSARETGSASDSTPLLPDEYEGLIERVRETANAMIPRNATVLVVSRGDEELLRIGPRRALHFPQDEFGRYAGYHPRGQRRCDRVPREHARHAGPSTCCCRAPRSGGSTTTRGSGTTSRATMRRSCRPTTASSSSSAATGVQTAAADADTKAMSAATSSPAARRAAGRAAPGAASCRRPHRRGDRGTTAELPHVPRRHRRAAPTERMPERPSSW